MVGHLATITWHSQPHAIIPIPKRLFFESVATSQFILYILMEGAFHLSGTITPRMIGGYTFKALTFVNSFRETAASVINWFG